MVLWYARRGIAWIPLLACLLLVVVATLALRQWPSTQLILLPGALACSAAAAGFLFDEPATAVVTVTPRGAGWRRTTRCAMALLPAAAWVITVGTLDQQSVAVDRSGWLLAGLGSQLVALGAAALASRHGVPSPGSAIASAVAILVLMPVVIGPMVGWEHLLPMGDFEAWATGVWTGALVVGAGLLARGVRPGLR